MGKIIQTLRNKIRQKLSKDEIEYLQAALHDVSETMKIQELFVDIFKCKRVIYTQLQNSVVNENKYWELGKIIPGFVTFEGDYKYLKKLLELDDKDFFTVFDKGKFLDGEKQYYLEKLNQLEDKYEKAKTKAKVIKDDLDYWNNKWKNERTIKGNKFESKGLKHEYLRVAIKYLYCLNYDTLDLFRCYGTKENTMADLFDSDYSDYIEEANEISEFYCGITWGLQMALESYGVKK